MFKAGMAVSLEEVAESLVWSGYEYLKHVKFYILSR